MNSRYRRNNNFLRGLKDYIVPILAIILIIILIFIFWWWDNDKKAKKEASNTNNIASIINFDSEDTEVELVKLSWKKDKITDKSEFYKWEQIIVNNWSISFNIDWAVIFKLSRSGIFDYKKDGTFYLSSWNLWIESSSNFEIKTKFWKVKLPENSIVNISQYDTAFSLYDFTWKSEIENNVWVKTILSIWEEIQISVSDASNQSLDLLLEKKEMSETFKTTDWYIKNWWEEILQKALSEKKSTWTWETIALDRPKLEWNNYIKFDNIEDESNISKSEIDIKWIYNLDFVSNISINNKVAKLNTKTWEFEIKKFPLTYETNDLIVKIYDINWNIIDKKLITIYNQSSNLDAWSSSELIDNTNNLDTNSDDKKSSWAFNVVTFNIDASKIKFSEPSSTWMFTTYDDMVTIRWTTPANTFSKISVNDFVLSSFNWTSWRYHAFKSSGNLNTWTNQYKINYYDNNWKVAYTNYFTIIKLDSSKKNLNKTNNQEENISDTKNNSTKNLDPKEYDEIIVD